MFVILTSRPGQYRTEAGEGMRPVEAWDYVFCGRPRARFVIAALDAPGRVRIVDEGPPAIASEVPTKFLPRFETLEAARKELGHLTRFGHIRAELMPVPA